MLVSRVKAASSSGRAPSLLACGTLCAALFAGGCFGSSDGIDPPLDSFYYPSGLVVSPGRTALYAINSDYDLQYNGGTVQLIDLPAVRAKVSSIAAGMNEGGGTTGACTAAGLAVNDNATQYPGPCGPLDVKSFIRRRAIIGAFARAAVLVQNPKGPGAHLFVTVAGDPSVTFFEVADDSEPGAFGHCGDSAFCLYCGVGDRERCSGEHRIGEDPSTNVRGLSMLTEPVGIAASEITDSTALIVAHQMDHAASLIVDDWDGKPPRLEYHTGAAADGPNEVATLPVPAIVNARSIVYQPGFLMTYRAAPQLDLFRYIDDAHASPERPFLSRVGGISINTNAGGSDSRGIAIDSYERKNCEKACGALMDPALGNCLRECADIPLRMYIANRTPASLLVGRIRAEFTESESAAYDVPSLHESFPLVVGASKVAIGQVIDKTGALVRRVFTVAFDSRLVFSYDPEARRVDAIIHTGPGPHSIAFDTGDDGDGLHSHMYIGHFTDSYVGVVDLDMRRAKTYGSMVLTLGVPKPPESSE